MKKILTLIIVVLSVLLIYLGFNDKKIYYLSFTGGSNEKNYNCIIIFIFCL